MIPVISPITSIIAYGVGVYFDFQPAASNTPTSWTITGLPPGMSANATTGLITGAPTALGIFDVAFVATNGTGASAPVVAPMVIGAGPGITDPVIELNFDLETCEITAPNAATAATAAVSSTTSATPAVVPTMFGKTGDKILVALGFVRGDTTLIPQTPQTIKLALKEFDPDALVDLSNGTFRIVWLPEGPRYIFLVDLTPGASPTLASIESGYEGDQATQADMVAEICVTFLAQVLTGGGEQSLPRHSQNFTFRVGRSLN